KALMLAMPERTAAIQNIHKTACFTFIEMLLGCAAWRGSEYAAPGQVRTPAAAAGRRVEGRLRPPRNSARGAWRYASMPRWIEDGERYRESVQIGIHGLHRMRKFCGG